MENPQNLETLFFYLETTVATPITITEKFPTRKHIPTMLSWEAEGRRNQETKHSPKKDKVELSAT